MTTNTSWVTMQFEHGGCTNAACFAMHYNTLHQLRVREVKTVGVFTWKGRRREIEIETAKELVRPSKTRLIQISANGVDWNGLTITNFWPMYPPCGDY